MASTTQKYRAPALDKGLDILELLARASEPPSMTAIASAIGYTKGEIFRMLQVLEERGYIARKGRSGYELTNQLFLLGMERPRIKSLTEAALPQMHVLAEKTRQACHLVVASDAQIVVIARVEPPDDLGFVVRVGHRLPLVHSTSGMVLFAFQNDDVRHRWLDIFDASDVAYARERFVAQADAIREQGHAMLPSGDVDAVTDLTAPILCDGSAVGALTIPHVERRPVKVPMKKALEYLDEAVAAISKELIQ